MDKTPDPSPHVSQVWADWFSGSAYRVDKRLRQIFRILPADPRCKFCNAPFRGAGGALVRALWGKEQSTLNPRFCNMCDQASRVWPGGAEVSMSMLFADVRGSTSLSETMTPTAFSGLINRFYITAGKIISEADGLVEEPGGDAVAAFWGAGFAGPEYVRRTVRVAADVAKAMAREQIPVGMSVHAGLAYFGAIGTPGGLTTITAVGDEVNTAARLAAQAAAGEIIVSEQALKAAGIDGSGWEARTLDLKGLSRPMHVRVMVAG